MSVSHILVPYDGSIHSERAFDEALKIAKIDKSKISTITCYWQKAYCHFWGNVDFTKNFEDYINPKKFAAKVDSLEKKAKKEEIPFFNYHIETPYIVANILSYAKEHKVDLVIMGSRNIKGIKKIFEGSISEEIKRHAHCIVKIVT